MVKIAAAGDHLVAAVQPIGTAVATDIRERELSHVTPTMQREAAAAMDAVLAR